jgi:predicted phage terminase large subunit-like protein
MQIVEALRPDISDVAPLLRTPAGRRALTERDPLLFAYVYFPHHLKDAEGHMTVCDFHLDLLSYALSWAKPSGKRKENRACFIAPRQSGKSTWIFLILPMWAAAHGHRKFVAAFSDSEQQAMTHLYTFKQELETNDLLKTDFPGLCNVHKSNNNARAMMDNRNQTRRENNFIFMAKGADSAALGMKVGEVRPDVLLFDDIEPGESNYSDYEAKKRKETLLADLFPLNDWAVVTIVGTTTMPDSLIDQMRKVKLSQDDYDGDIEWFRDSLDPDHRWVVDENINVHYWPVIIPDNDGEKSLWPERWPLDELNRDRHTRSFAKNMMNRPVSSDGGYWDEDDIDIDQPKYYKHTLLSIDPAVTTAKRSDYTGLAVLSLGNDNKIYVRHAEQVKLGSDALASKVSEIVDAYGVGIALVETNQGGDLWRQVFRDLPCKFKTIRQKEKKEIRASQVVDFYKRGQVKHEKHFHVAEEQMLAFPRVTHDDVVDAICTGVLTFKKYARGGIKVTQTQYMEV